MIMDLTRLTRDQIGKAEWDEVLRRLEWLKESEAQVMYLAMCLEGSRNRIDDDTETINRQCKELGQLRERLERCEATLKSLYSHKTGPDEWGIKCIEDHNAIIVETLGYVPEGK